MTPAPRIPPPAPDARPMYGTELDLGYAPFAASVVRASEVDPVTTELVRLRCARYHDCRLCGSLRYQDAIDSGFDEELGNKIDRYETSDLEERHKAALRLADAMIVDPAGIGDDLRADLREHFGEAEIAELLLDVMKWSHQKVKVSLRLDAPVRDGLSSLSFDGEGHHRLGGAVK
jgi:hypothetical protein